jgi:glycosyltransferase involved in cell wall biosynthesis
MYKQQKIAIVIPAYNEENLIFKAVDTIPAFVDYIIVVNDASSDSTTEVLHKLSEKHKRLKVLKNDINLGVGGSVVKGFRYAIGVTDANVVGVMAGDAQCDPNFIEPMLDTLLDEDFDYVKANRFFHREALKTMPAYRQIGNIIISLLTKFSTGYYSISDTQNGYGFFKASSMKKMNLDLIGERYDYENTMLIALSIIGARIKDHPVPAIYGDEVSTIKFLPTVMRALRAVWVGFWKRIYYKYVLFSFHPVALFLFSGLLLGTTSTLFGLYITYRRIFEHVSPSTGTVMLIVLPLILGFQTILSAIIIDMNNEDKH